MLESKINSLIIKVALFICDKQDEPLIAQVFKNGIYEKYNFPREEIYSIEIFLRSKNKDEFIMNELQNSLEELDVALTQNQRLLILLRAVLYGILSGSKESIERVRILNCIFGFRDELVDYCIGYISSNVKITELEKDMAAGYFFQMPEEYDSVFFKFVLSISEGYSIKRKIKLKSLNSNSFMDTMDKRALEAIKNMNGFEEICKKVFECGIERIYILQKTGSNIKVTENNFPDLYRVLRQSCEILDVKCVPELYLEQGFINAYTIGSDRHIIVLGSASIGCLNEDELMFVLGHELGHIKCEHVFYHWMASSILPALGSLIGNVTLGLGNLISGSIQLALLNWVRKSEFSADRAGLLNCQSYDAAVKTFMKISGAPIRYYNSLNTEHFLQQARTFEGYDEDSLNKLLKMISIANQDHPWTVMRASMLDRWVKSGAYDMIINRYSQSESISMW